MGDEKTDQEKPRKWTVPNWHKWTSREYKGQRRNILKELGKM